MILTKLFKIISDRLRVVSDRRKDFFMAIYVDDSVDLNYYKYILQFGDNYVDFIHSNRINLSSGDSNTYAIYRQYFNPPYTTIYYKRFYGPYIENFSSVTNSSYNFSNSIFDRADFPSIFICSFIVLFIFGWILNQLTKIFYKGRCFWI